jgi:hypothetical protein
MFLNQKIEHVFGYLHPQVAMKVQAVTNIPSFQHLKTTISTVSLYSDQIFKVQTRFCQHIGVDMCALHTLLEGVTVFRKTAELSLEHTVEVIHMLFRPLDTSGHHNHGKAGLIYQCCVFDNREVYEGDLVDVEM